MECQLVSPMMLATPLSPLPVIQERSLAGDHATALRLHLTWIRVISPKSEEGTRLSSAAATSQGRSTSSA
jgi:hypothetical protein